MMQRCILCGEVINTDAKEKLMESMSALYEWIVIMISDIISNDRSFCQLITDSDGIMC